MSLLIGQMVGRYQVREQLGEGGMANVYKAWDTRLERFVAIKVIRTDAFAPGMLEQVLKRFEREARSLARLSHPNIVQVYDFGEHEGAPYLVMEFLPSGNLKSRAGAPMPWREAIDLLLPVARALSYAHENNIIHRDIKPGNILLTARGRPMLTDFGIAKVLESSEGATLTSTGMGIGTPEYMAPEQWLGQAGPQSDIYSLGVVLYELVCGRKPYTADTPLAVMLKQSRDPLPPPSTFTPGLPPALEQVLLHALANAPEERFPSMAGFASALEALTAATLPATAYPVDTTATVLAQPPVTSPTMQPPGAATILAEAGSPAAGYQVPPPGKVTGLVGGTPLSPAAIPAVPYPAQAQPRKASGAGRWVLIVLVVLLLFGGGTIAAGLVLRNMRRNVPAVTLAPPTQPSLPVQVPVQTLPPANAPALTNVPTQTGQQLPEKPTSPPPTVAPSFTPTPSQFRVLWDISHGPRQSTDGPLYSPDGLYQPLVKALAVDKFIVTGGDLSNLSSYDILVLAATSAVKTPYTSQDADAIEQFVRTGGHGLLLLGEIPGFGNVANGISSRFFINMGQITSDGPVSLSDEPFFSGVSSIQFLFGGGVFQVGAPAQSAALDKSGDTVIAFCECDLGRVMAIGDSNLWDDRGLSQADNQRFAVEVFKWLVKLTP